MRRFLLVLVLPAFTGCVVPGPQASYAPLHAYNDAWEGTIHFMNGRDRPVRIEIYSTQLDQEMAASPSWTNLEMTVYAELKDKSTGNSFIGTGTASHYDRRDLASKNFSPIEGREFLDLELGQTPEDPSAPLTTTARMKDYLSQWKETLGDEGQDTTSVPFLGLTGEYSATGIQGIAYLTSDAGTTKVQVGTFELAPSSEPASGRAISNGEIDTDEFSFITTHHADQSYSFTEEFKP